MMELVNKKVVLTMDIGMHGNLFGGTLMAWIDEAAASLATEFCHTPNMVTIRVGELLFKKPLKVGNHVRLYGEVEHVGNTSVTMNIEARRLNVYSGDEVVVCVTSITYVRIDDDGNPTPIGQSARERFERIKKAKEEKSV